MSILKNFLKRFKDKAQAFRAAHQAGIARDFAKAKAVGRKKLGKSLKTPYQFGSIGLSSVAERIAKDNGGLILSRAERKQAAKQSGKPFKAYYN